MPNSIKLRVLIVDDEPLITIFIKRLVKESGHTIVDICYDSDHAIKAITTHQPDIIFMDINIKGPLDGISVIRKAVTYDAIVYYISAYNDSEIIQEALDTKAYNYLVKPIKEEDIKIALGLAKNIKNIPVVKAKNQLTFSHEIVYDYDSKALLQRTTPISLTSIEQKLVDIFVEHINQNLSIEVLKTKVWMDKDVASVSIRGSISLLRKKLPELKIETNFGKGYMMVR